MLENARTTQAMLVGHIYFNSRPHSDMVWGIVTTALVNSHLLPPNTLDKVHNRIAKFVMWLCAHPTSNQSQTFKDMVMKAEEGKLNADGRDVQLRSLCVGLVQWIAEKDRGAENRNFNIVQGVMINEQCKLILEY
jgi:hypothetical protein